MRLHRKGIAACVLALGLALAAAPVRAFPIPPQPLGELVADSDLIVVAEVLEIRKIPVRNRAAGSTAETAVAVLRILERWKGNENGTIEVPYLSEVTCPAPPVYREGENVLAFLKRTRVGPVEKGWSTVGMSYGTLYPDRAELADFRVRVRRAVALQTKKSMTPS